MVCSNQPKEGNWLLAKTRKQHSSFFLWAAGGSQKKGTDYLLKSVNSAGFPFRNRTLEHYLIASTSLKVADPPDYIECACT